MVTVLKYLLSGGEMTKPIISKDPNIKTTNSFNRSNQHKQKQKSSNLPNCYSMAKRKIRTSLVTKAKTFWSLTKRDDGKKVWRRGNTIY